MISKIFDILNGLELKGYEESWGYIKFSTQLTNKNKIGLKLLKNNISEELPNTFLNFYSEKYGDDFEFEELDENDKCIVNINKMKLNLYEEVYFNFFYSYASFFEWSKIINPFDKTCPINLFERLKIIVNGVKSSFGGSNILITENINDNFDVPKNLPEESKIFSQVHFILSRTKYFLQLI